jgi:hypothetical protein
MLEQFENLVVGTIDKGFDFGGKIFVENLIKESNDPYDGLTLRESIAKMVGEPIVENIDDDVENIDESKLDEILKHFNDSEEDD